MRILLTNDDSISSKVLPALATWAKKHGEVTVVVPKYEQSAKSHSIEIHKPFEVTKQEIAPGIEAYAVDSSPADCVRFAVAALGGNYDLVISGINRGFNIGLDIIYSGTVSAVMEAACHRIPRAVALSTDPASFEDALRDLDKVYDYFAEHDLFGKNHIYNVNIPLASKGIRITRMGGPYFSDDFAALENNMYQAVGKSVWEDSANPELDTDSVLTGYTSITPLELDRTNEDVFCELVGKDKAKYAE